MSLSLPDRLDVHGLGVSQAPPGGGGGGQRWRGAAAVSRVGGVVRVMRMAVVQEERRVRLRGVHVLHGRVHVVHQLLQVHIIIWGGAGWDKSGILIKCMK